MSITHIIFLSPQASNNPQDGHYFTVYESWVKACQRYGINPVVWSAKDRALARGHQVVNYGRNGEWELDLDEAFRPLNGVPAENILVVVYEGTISALPAVTELARRGIRTLFNFLSSHELVQLRLMVRGSSRMAVEELTSLAKALEASGTRFTGDTGVASRLLKLLGFPAYGTFPIFSSLEDRRQFANSDFDVSILNPNLRQLLVFSCYLRASSYRGRRLKSKILSQSELPSLARKALKDTGAEVLIGKYAGEDYMQAISSKRWVLDSRRVHHIFGSSGQYLDLVANKAQVFSFKYAAMSESASRMLPNGWSSMSPIRHAFRSLKNMEGYEELQVKTPSESLLAIVDLFSESENGNEPRVQGLEIHDSLATIARTRGSLAFNLIVRVAYRLPRCLFVRIMSSRA
jgi:hypothetical protein